jgi:hypothetical protein
MTATKDVALLASKLEKEKNILHSCPQTELEVMFPFFSF